jgi:hypothetical protein
MNAGNGRNELCDYEHEMSIMAQLDEAEKTIEALQQENERLKIQAARMRDVALMISKYTNPLELDKVHFAEFTELCEEAEATLPATPTTYHNPADVAALKLAKEALKPLLKLAVLVNNEKYAKGEYEGAGVAMGWGDKAKEAIAAIDKIAEVGE